MWDCPECGCQSIAAPLPFCPMCTKERTDMPTITSAGPSNEWEPQPDQPEDAQVVGEAGPELPAEQLPTPKTVRKPRRAAQLESGEA